MKFQFSATIGPYGNLKRKRRRRRRRRRRRMSMHSSVCDRRNRWLFWALSKNGRDKKKKNMRKSILNVC